MQWSSSNFMKIKIWEKVACVLIWAWMNSSFRWSSLVYEERDGNLQLWQNDYYSGFERQIFSSRSFYSIRSKRKGSRWNKWQHAFSCDHIFYVLVRLLDRNENKLLSPHVVLGFFFVRCLTTIYEWTGLFMRWLRSFMKKPTFMNQLMLLLPCISRSGTFI